MQQHLTSQTVMADVSATILNKELQHVNGGFTGTSMADTPLKKPLTPTSLKRNVQALEDDTLESSPTSHAQNGKMSAGGKENESLQSNKKRTMRFTVRTELEGIRVYLNFTPGPYFIDDLSDCDMEQYLAWSPHGSAVPTHVRNLLARNVHEKRGTLKEVANTLKDHFGASVANSPDFKRRFWETFVSDVASPMEMGVSSSEWDRVIADCSPEDREVVQRMPRTLSVTVWILRDLSVFPAELKVEYERRLEEFKAAHASLLDRLHAFPPSQLIDAAKEHKGKSSSSQNQQRAQKSKQQSDVQSTASTIPTSENGSSPVKSSSDSSLQNAERQLQKELKTQAKAEKERVKAEKEAEKVRLQAEKEAQKAAHEAEKSKKEAAKEAARKDKELKDAEKQQKETARLEAMRQEEMIKTKSSNFMMSFLSRTSPASKSAEPVDHGVEQPREPSCGPDLPTRHGSSRNLAQLDYFDWFKPFHLRAHTQLAPHMHRPRRSFEFEQIAARSVKIGDFFERRKQTRRRHLPRPEVRFIMRKISEAAVDGSEASTFIHDLQNRSLIPVKVLRFHEDYRPAYCGTHSKASTSVRPRRPFGKDLAHVNYDYDSESEWVVEEEGDGEDLMSLDGEDAEDGTSEPDTVSDGGWIDDDLVDPANTQVRRPRMLQRLIPVIKGLCWEEDPALATFTMESIQCQFPVDPFTLPFREGDHSLTGGRAPHQPASKGTSSVRPLDETELAIFVDLVHGSARSKNVLIELAQERLPQNITKLALEKQFKALVDKVGKGREAKWFVKDDAIAQRYHLEPITLPQRLKKVLAKTLDASA